MATGAEWSSSTINCTPFLKLARCSSAALAACAISTLNKPKHKSFLSIIDGISNLDFNVSKQSLDQLSSTKDENKMKYKVLPIICDRYTMNHLREQQAAVALGYEQHIGAAPRVLAAGFGNVAKSILSVAREHDMHIHKDKSLAPLLARVPVGQEIPEEAYQVVAELLAFLYQTDKSMRNK
jgi:flagellar biosynthesis protein